MKNYTIFFRVCVDDWEGGDTEASRPNVLTSEGEEVLSTPVRMC